MQRAGTSSRRPPQPGRRFDRATESSGSPLPQELSQRFGASLGADLSRVRVHADSASGEAAEELAARAFTVGQEIFFGGGEYAPASREGQRLLAHEVAHTVQQAGAEGARPQAEAVVSRAGDALEVEADRAADAMIEGRGAPPLSAVAQAPIQRYEGANTPEGLIDEESGFWGLDEIGLGRKLRDLAWMGPAHYGVVLAVWDELDSGDRDEVGEAFTQGCSDDDLEEFARNSTGKRMLRRIMGSMATGTVMPGETGQAVRISTAIGRVEGAEKGRERGEEVLGAAESVADVPPPPGEEAPVLSVAELQNRLRLMEVALGRIESTWSSDEAVQDAVGRVRGRLSTVRESLSADDAEDQSRLIVEAQHILDRCERNLLQLDLQIATYQADSSIGVAGEEFVALTERVRGHYVEAFGLVLDHGATGTFNRAERVAAALPRALTEVELGVLGNRGGSYNMLEPSRAEMAEWASWVQGRLSAFESEAAAVAEARRSGAEDLSSRIEAFQAEADLIQNSIEGLRHWEQALRGYEYLAGGTNLVPGGYGAIGRIIQRCQAMRDAAFAEDAGTLREKVERHAGDEAVQTFYRALPVFVGSSRMLVAFGIVLVAAMATAGVSGIATAAIGTTETAAGSALAFGGTVALEALTFTAVSRGLGDAAGQPSHSSALVDLAFNVGLFGVLRLAGAGVRAGLAARGLEAATGPATAAASYGLLMGYGTLRFRIEQGRWPSSDEIGTMALETLVMVAGLTVAMRAVHRGVQGVRTLRNLRQLEKRYGERFIEFEAGRQRLLERFREALERGEATDAELVEDLRSRSSELESMFRDLVEEVRADRSFDLEALRGELRGMEVDPVEGSEALLGRTFGMPAEVGLRSGGAANSYTYRWGGTGRLEARLRDMGAHVEKSADPVSGLRTIEARPREGADPLTFVERPSPFPGRAEVEVDPTDPAIVSLLGEFSVRSPQAQRFVLREIAVERASKPDAEMRSVLRPVRRYLRRLRDQAAREGLTLEQKLLAVRAVGKVASEATPAQRAAAGELEVDGILESRAWLDARTPEEFEGAVAELLAYRETAERAPSDTSVLRSVKFKGSLFEDPTMTRPHLDPESGAARTETDVGPELDLMSVADTGLLLEVVGIGNVKAFRGGAGDAANQNALAVEMLRAHIENRPAAIETRSGDVLWARIDQVTALDPRTGSTVDLTGRLGEGPAGIPSETIGPAGRRSNFDRTLGSGPRDIRAIVEILREKQLMSTPEY